ncbi:ABC transporter permease [Listeria monocytogenes]|uniref:ABC transporter permease n=1 Tax=Listeria monocytogenes TaxID=1639 RepID=UPI0010BB1CC2|nr:ABC transporter permease [Listeria monocytogenes]EHC5237250.1 ABC transporter permease [Listeria monocytogenes serotype 1/2a]EAC2785492.1 ABC transporter permease [Listeria monocytogenes]EAD4093089.1 ABC transporter permease [Listeria monocytogenes]EAD8947963.1 ABC transporter permease [Listeria monocytogenes]EAE6285526.1 ABC transporter permease [Listeria monocytogenes]
MINLVYNEQLKLWRKKRLIVILALVAIIVAIFTYAQFRQHQEDEKQAGTSDWHVQTQQQIVDLENRLGTGRLPEEYQKYFKVLVGQLQYYLDHDINPNAPGAPTFLKTFVENGISLLFPLFIMVIAADLISAETSAGTMKFLLTRPVKRWRILTSKYVSMLLSISAIMVLSAVIAYLISGIVFGYGGWDAPVLTGFGMKEGAVTTTDVYQLPVWQLLLMEFGLAWFVSVVVGVLTMFVSVLVRSTAAVMGIMLASLITGTILTNLVSSWPSAKYLFMVNLQLTNYLNGSSPPVEGMTLSFSMLVLTAWMLVAFILSYFIFTKRDVY